MTADHLIPVAALLDLEDKARHAARALVPLVAATFRAQFPTGAYLVLARSSDGELSFDSVRDADGGSVYEFPEAWWAVRLPHPLPDDLDSLWGAEKGRDLLVIRELLERIDHYGVLRFLPDQAMRPGEDTLEKTPVGIPLEPAQGATC
ncbi:hypothetical protein ABZ468_07625 [Streptomyces sp. NPDC005708]|uniref:hypothetical protein n=1 Tax=Streptomyces sp. NPDC005708 TaxID=3154564 RepID=UPI00340F52F0